MLLIIKRRSTCLVLALVALVSVSISTQTSIQYRLGLRHAELLAASYHAEQLKKITFLEGPLYLFTVVNKSQK